ncbi:unnamed protein product [Cylicocyclus nassatus]|uniref:Fanconi-associated nuclease n=1 Tax=Cylicocyclus nassatus TaxID=53992 RepID=A0AA36GGS8_CYLNA|nr:unnamed protein product [Cylicocyclus nassatus]
MTSTFRMTKKKEVVVKEKNTIMAAFKRQEQKKTCPLCKESILLTLYRAHMDKCQLTGNDDDCEIIQVLSAEEGRALRAGSPIVIDAEDSQKNLTPSTDNVSQESGRKRRSGRIVTESESAEEVKMVKIEPSTPTPIEPENRPPDAKRLSEPEKTAQVTTVKRTKRITACVSSPLLEQKPSTSADEPIRLPSPEPLNLVTADEIVKKTEAILNTFMLSPRKKLGSQENSEDTLSTDSRRTPYIVKFALLILRRVMMTLKSDGGRYDEKFWGKHMRTFDRFLNLSKAARELFMRLHLRKSWWLTIEKLRERYAELSLTMDESLKELVDIGFVDSDRHLSDLEEVLQIAPLPILKVVAKKYQIDITKGKIELITTLKTFSAKQKGLFGQTSSVAVAMAKTVKKELGACYRINRNISMIFKALFTLYAPTEMCSSLVIDQPSLNLSQNLLYTLLRMDQGAVQFPAPNPCQHILSIYDNKEELMEYVEAKELETELVFLMSTGKLDGAYECAFKARERLLGLSEESRSRAADLSISLRRYTAFAVLIRCIAHGAGVLERQKKYATAISWQRFLLKTPELKPFCTNARGAWWDRLALNLDAHMKEREEALQEIREGMDDDAVADKDKLMLQDRAIRISNGDFLERIVIMNPIKKEILGTTLAKELGDSKINRFVVKDDVDFAECSVEEIVRRHYLAKEGFNNGVHAEGSIWHTILGLLFYDIVFDHSLKDVWLSELQAHPIDLNSRDLYKNRQERFDERFAWLETTTNEEIEDVVRSTWSAQHAQETSEINWELFHSVDDLLVFLFCCPRPGLLAVLRRVITDYRNCRSGFPDLTVWNSSKKTVAVVEVKGPGDKLSTKQRLWLDYFMRNGIRAEVCHVIAEGSRKLRK